MTDTPVADTHSGTPFPENLPKNGREVATILRLRNNTQTNAALRKAGSQATTHYALPYLSQLWTDTPWKKTPTLVLAYLMAATQTSHDATIKGGVGTTAALFKQYNVETKLLRIQTMRLTQTVPDLYYILSLAAKQNTKTNWNRIWQTLKQWEHPDYTTRIETRQKVLEEYYQTLYRTQRTDEQEN